MLHQDDLWLTEELPVEETSDLLEALPEIRQHVGPGRPREEGGMRSILERPEALSCAWWRYLNAPGPRTRRGRRPSSTLRPV